MLWPPADLALSLSVILQARADQHCQLWVSKVSSKTLAVTEVLISAVPVLLQKLECQQLSAAHDTLVDFPACSPAFKQRSCRPPWRLRDGLSSLQNQARSCCAHKQSRRRFFAGSGLQVVGAEAVYTANEDVCSDFCRILQLAKALQVLTGICEALEAAASSLHDLSISDGTECSVPPVSHGPAAVRHHHFPAGQDWCVWTSLQCCTLVCSRDALSLLAESPIQCTSCAWLPVQSTMTDKQLFDTRSLDSFPGYPRLSQGAMHCSCGFTRLAFGLVLLSPSAEFDVLCGLHK